MTEIFVYWRPRTQKLKNQRGVGEIVNNDTSKWLIFTGKKCFRTTILLTIIVFTFKILKVILPSNCFY